MTLFMGKWRFLKVNFSKLAAIFIFLNILSLQAMARLTIEDSKRELQQQLLITSNASASVNERVEAFKQAKNIAQELKQEASLLRIAPYKFKGIHYEQITVSGNYLKEVTDQLTMIIHLLDNQERELRGVNNDEATVNELSSIVNQMGEEHQALAQLLRNYIQNHNN